MLTTGELFRQNCLIKELKTRCSKKQMEDIVQFIED